MVNSGSFDSTDGNRNGKTRCTQAGDAAIGSQSSGSDDAACKGGCSKSADGGDLPSDESAIEPTPTKTEINSSMPSDASLKNEFLANDGKSPAACSSFTTEKTQNATNSNSSTDNSEYKAKHTRKLLCLYCDRSFVSANLRQKHVERVHSVKPTRRVSARRQNQLSTTPCVHCDKLNSSEHTLNDLFQHLVQEHSAKYFGCLSCEERFLTSTYLTDHNKSKHVVEEATINATFPALPQISDDAVFLSNADNISQKLTRSKLRSKVEESLEVEENSSLAKRKKKSKLKELRNKKISVKTSKIAIKRSKRLQQQAKEHDQQKKRRDKKSLGAVKPEITSTNKQPEKSKPLCVNPYPQFDNFYRVKKITDHSIDNLKISSLTFDDVFDKAFFNRIKCNIEENLLHHIDGKLFKNEESESRISNFEKILTATQEAQNSNADNYGCELSLNAITPAPSLSLNSQFGEDFESQIEYGSKPSKKKTQIRSDEVHYKYFTRRKYQASILQQRENRDLSKLDMWTQMVVKERQERVLNKKKSAKELQEYTSGQEYKSKMKKQELNRILDRRGPFEDLKEEQTKKAAFDKLNSSTDSDISEEVFTDVREVLNELLNKVFEAVEEDDSPLEESSKEIDQRQIPAYLDLRRKTSSTQEEVDKSDKIALICSSQETENFELPTNAVRGKNELVELTGEWARSRMYICAACGGKFSNMKYLLEHKSLYHQNVWVQHYEFVGNQGELYKHLSIPGLGKVGIVEETVPCKQWRRSDARTCTKCGKQCNALGELHRHVLECGGDWTWMLARKKCKYRPYGTRSRRKRRGFEPKINNKRKTEPSEKKIYKKPMDGPRQRPSDADTIQRMLANLPAKRCRRSIMSLTDVVFKSRKTNSRNVSQTRPTTKVKRGKALHNKQQADAGKSSSNQQRTNRALRSLNKVLSTRILDLNSSLLVKRKMKVIRNQRLTRNALQRAANNRTADVPKEVTAENNLIESNSGTQQTQKRRKSPKKDTDLEESKAAAQNAANNKTKSIAKRMLTSHLNLKNFFPVKKKNSRPVQDNSGLDKVSSESEYTTKSDKAKYLENFEHTKKSKRGGLKGFVRALSLGKRNSNREESIFRTDVTDTRNSSKKDEQIPEKSETTRKANARSKTKQILPSEKAEADNTQPVSSSEDANSKVLSNKRKLQRSFRNVINKVKKIKSEKISNKLVENAQVQNGKEDSPDEPFLEETQLQDCATPEKFETLVEDKGIIQEKQDHAHIVANFTDSKENPPIPETIFNLANNEETGLQAKGELDFDVKQCDLADTTPCSNNLSVITDNLELQPNSILDCKITPVAIDTSLKPKCVPLISPNLKGRMRKPSRGLNDCIAMLTSKLQQKDDKISSSLESLFSTSSTTSMEPRTESRPFLDSVTAPVKIPEPGITPKIPIFSTSKSPVIEETALDLSKKSLSTPNLLLSNSNDSVFSGNVLENKDKRTLNYKLQASTWTSVDDIIQQVVQNSSSNCTPYVFNKPKKNVVGRTKVDDTIDFVVNTSLDWFESKQTSLHEKPKHRKRSRRRKHSDDNLITNILFGKDKLIIAPSSNSKSDFEDPLIAKIKENEYKMSRSRHILEKVGPITSFSEIPSLPGTEPLLCIVKTQNLAGRPSEGDKINHILLPKVIEKELNKISSEKPHDSVISQQKIKVKSYNEIAIDVNEISATDTNNIESEKVTEAQQSSPIKEIENSKSNVSAPVQIKSVKQKTPLKGTNRRRRKPRKVKSQNKPKKTVIETNIDDYMGLKEVVCDSPDTTIINILPDSRDVISTNKKIELSTENEPAVLENKIIERTAKLLSDSEDEVPLVALIGPSFQQESNASSRSLLITGNKKEDSLLEESREVVGVPELPEASIKTNVCPADSLNDTKDMVETLTTDSLKENVEGTVTKRNTILDSELRTGQVNSSNITISAKKKRKRKKILFRNKKRLQNKKNFNTKKNVSPDSKANPEDSPYFTTQDELDATLTERNSFTSIDLPMDERLNLSALKATPGDSETLNLKAVQPVAGEREIPIKLLNSQRTRRKSKRSKKLEKIDNDLFKDFSLVINKKTKRIPPTSIVDDSVCDDILDTGLSFFVKPLEVNKESDVKHPDVNSDAPLNDSVEEMDMEIEDIPVNTTIIERDNRQLATLSLYKEAEDSIHKSELSVEEIESLTVEKSVKKNNSADLIDIVDDLCDASILKVVASNRRKNAREESLEQGHVCTNFSNIEKTAESLRTIEDVDDLKSPESTIEQQELIPINIIAISNKIEEKSCKIVRNLTENIHDNPGSLIFSESENETCTNTVKYSDSSSVTNIAELYPGNTLTKRSCKQSTKSLVNSPEKDPTTEPEGPQEPKDKSTNASLLDGYGDKPFIVNVDVSTDLFSYTNDILPRDIHASSTGICSQLSNLSLLPQNIETFKSTTNTVFEKAQEDNFKTLSDPENAYELIDSKFDLPLKESTPKEKKNVSRRSKNNNSIRKSPTEVNTSDSDFSHVLEASDENINEFENVLITNSIGTKDQYIAELSGIKCLEQMDDTQILSSIETTSEFKENSKIDAAITTSLRELAETTISVQQIYGHQNGEKQSMDSQALVSDLTPTRDISTAESVVLKNATVDFSAPEKQPSIVYSENNRKIRIRRNRQNKKRVDSAPEAGNERSFRKIPSGDVISNTSLSDDSFMTVDDDLPNNELFDETKIPKTKSSEKTSDKDIKSSRTDSFGKKLDVCYEKSSYLVSGDKLISDKPAAEIEMIDEPRTFKQYLSTYPLVEKENDNTANRDNKIESTNEPFRNEEALPYDRVSQNLSDDINTFDIVSTINLQLKTIEKLTDDSGFIEKLLEDSMDRKITETMSKRDFNKQNNSLEEGLIENTEETKSNKMSPYEHAGNTSILRTQQPNNEFEDSNKHLNAISDIIETSKSGGVDNIVDIQKSLGVADLQTHRLFSEKAVSSEKMDNKKSAVKSLLKQNKNKDLKNSTQLSNILISDIAISNLELEQKTNKQIETFIFESAKEDVSSILDNLEKSVHAGNTSSDNQELTKSFISNVSADDFIFDGSFDLLGRRRSSRNKSVKPSIDLNSSNLINLDKTEEGNYKQLQDLQEELRSASNTRKLSPFEIESRNNRLSSDSNNSSISSNTHSIFNSEIKGRRSRKIISYNEDDLEKRSMELNDEINTQDSKLNKDVMPQTKKNRKMKKNANNIEESSEEPMVNKNTGDNDHTHLNKGSILPEVVNDKALLNIEMQNKNNQMNSEELDLLMGAEQAAETCDKKRKKKNKQKYLDSAEKPEIDNLFPDEIKPYTSESEIDNGYSWAADMLPLVYKVSEFYEIPKLVVDIHHVDQIDQKLHENVVETSVDESDNTSLESGQNIQLNENSTLINATINTKSLNSVSMVTEAWSDDDLGVFNLEASSPSEKNVDNESIGKSTNKTNVLDSAGETTLFSTDKEKFFQSPILSRKQIERQEAKLEDQSIISTSLDSTTNSFTHFPTVMRPVKCARKINKKSDAAKQVENLMALKGDISTRLDDVENDSQPSMRYNRRSRKNINYNEEVLLSNAESLLNSSVTEKRTKRRSDKSLNCTQNLFQNDEKGTNNDISVNESVIKEKLNGKTFEDDKIASSSDFGEATLTIGVTKAKPKNEKINTFGTDIQEPSMDFQTIAQSTLTKDIFEFEENLSNEEQNKTTSNTFLKNKKQASTLLADVDANSKSDKNSRTKEDFVESPQVLAPEFNSSFQNDSFQILDPTDITSKSTKDEETDSSLVTNNSSNIAKSDSIIDISKFEKLCTERKVKRTKKNIMDIDVANILDSDNDSTNRRSPRKRKPLSEKSSKLPLESTVPEEDVPALQANNFVVENKTHFGARKVFTADVSECEIKPDRTPEILCLESMSKLERENNFSLRENIPEKHSSDSNESLPLLKRMNDVQNKLAVKDNQRNNLSEINLPQDCNMGTTKCTLGAIDISKDYLPMLPVSSSEDLLQILDSCPVADDKSIPGHQENLLPPSEPDSMEGVVLETKPLSTKNKKRKTKGKKFTKNMFCEDAERTETLTESKSISNVQSYDQPERQYQLAKINIKDLLLSSLAPPDSIYLEKEQAPSKITSELSQLSNTTSNLDELAEGNHVGRSPKSDAKSTKIKSKKQQGIKPKHSTLNQDSSQLFDETVRENNIGKHKANKSILNKNISFTALKNVLSTFTKNSAKNAFQKSATVFSEMQPLKEIITSSEMDIAPVLDEIDKSLESDDMYDFNEGLHNLKNSGKHKSTKNISESNRLVEIDFENESDRRTSNRPAKFKALESIHEKALTEAQDFENITSNIQSKKTKKESKSLKLPEVINREKDFASGYEKNDIDKNSLFTFEANVLNTPTEKHESDLTNKMQVDGSSFSYVPKDTPKLNEELETLIRPNNNTIQDQTLNQNINSLEKSDHKQTDGDGLELRRSRRESRKVASYNENDLIDPLIDALEDRRNRSSRKDKSLEKYQIRNQAPKEAVNDKPKLSSEELFDMLKKSSFDNEKVLVSKPLNSFFDNLTETSSNGACQDVSDNELENIHEKPPEPTQERDAAKIYEFTEESPENTKEIKELFGKNKKSRPQGEIKLPSELPTYMENNISLPLLDNKVPEKLNDCDQEKRNYCDICKRSFIRIENLIKHKTTLTHISKLSELEAKEAEEKARLEKQAIEEQSNSSLKPIDALRDEINITDILQQSERSQVSIQKESPSLLHNNHSLKLVDIISDVLNKPVLETYSHVKQDFSTSLALSKEKGDIRRYKSLGERKSFESENHLSQLNAPPPTSYLQPPLSQTTILEKQINLLENIIGSNLENITANKLETENNFIDEISSCSIPSNVSDLDNNCTINKTVYLENIKANSDADFVKPTQYEEISEDSTSARVYDDPKQRKTLNRDEELFLECCSLLKSGSEVSNSNYSKNMKRPIDDYRELEDPAFLKNKKLKQTAEEAHEYCDNSRTPTPLGDTYDDDASNSNTISSNWHLNSEKPLDKNRSFSFEEVKNKEAAGMSFGDMLTTGLRNQFESIAKIDDRSRDKFEDMLTGKTFPIDDIRDDSDSSSASRKIATKGARKVYEGLKVSIPTEDLNLDVLNTSPLNKVLEMRTTPSSDENLEQTRAKPRSTRKSKPVKKSQIGSNLLFKVNKKKSSPQIGSIAPPVKQDIYNFEETQDNSEIIIKPTFKDVKGTLPDDNKDAVIHSDNESLGYADSIGADAKSVSSVSSISAMSAKKPEVTPENITKNKYKIMGKIFKNAAKSKMGEIDEELRSIPEIPEIDNLELVENYVRSCQRVTSPFMPPPPPPPLEELPKKPKMTEEEMNMIFDQLLGKEANEPKQEKATNKSSATKPKAESKNGDVKKKNTKVKNRKRARANSESSDDEFNINRTTKKRTNKKNNQEDSGINLELELKECIGVASRKSQRTCTSGKQNVLVEYWSSDEEAFEAMLENHRLPPKKEDDKKKAEKKKPETNEPPKTSASSEVIEKILDKPAKPKPARRKPQSDKKKPPSQKETDVNATVTAASSRRKRAAVNPLYHWSSSSEDESQSLIEIKPVREEDDEDDRPIQHGWIVGDSPKKLVTMLALTKGKKTDIDSVKEQGKRRTSNAAS